MLLLLRATKQLTEFALVLLLQVLVLLVVLVVVAAVELMVLVSGLPSFDLRPLSTTLLLQSTLWHALGLPNNEEALLGPVRFISTGRHDHP